MWKENDPDTSHVLFKFEVRVRDGANKLQMYRTSIMRRKTQKIHFHSFISFGSLLSLQFFRASLQLLEYVASNLDDFFTKESYLSRDVVSMAISCGSSKSTLIG